MSTTSQRTDQSLEGRVPMANQVTRQQMQRWLLRSGFLLKSGGKTSHRQFRGHGVTITLSSHGPNDLTKKHMGMILRKLKQAGFEKEIVLSSVKG